MFRRVDIHVMGLWQSYVKVFRYDDSEAPQAGVRRGMGQWSALICIRKQCMGWGGVRHTLAFTSTMGDVKGGGMGVLRGTAGLVVCDVAMLSRLGADTGC
jgi:hypothetical protein